MIRTLSLKRAVAGLEDGIIVLSGPCLAVSGIVAGVDLVTGGNILRNQPGLTLAWAITLLLTLDFQVLCLGVRAHRVYGSAKPSRQKVFEIVLAVLIAVAISYVSIQMQSIIARVNAENITLDRAAMQLGINTIALIWERSTLVLVLIFMSGWLREQDEKKNETPPPASVIQQPTIDEIVDRLDVRYQQRMEALYERTVETVKITLEQATNPQMPVIRQANVQAQIPEHANAADSSLHAGANPIDEQASTDTFVRVKAYLEKHPGASTREVGDALGFSSTTASKWMHRVKAGKE